MSKEITRIEGAVALDKGELFEFCEEGLEPTAKAYARMYPSMTVHPATLFISPDSTPPRVFTDPTGLWISVKDRLPEERELVLTLSAGDVHDNLRHRIIPFGAISGGFPLEVTHWMPLPGSPTL